MILLWILVFIASLAVIIKGADWLLNSAEKIGLAIGLSPFIVGVTIVGIGTSFPELISSLMAVFKDATEIVAANAIGSNIANILLIVGFSAIFGGRLIVSKSLIDLDLPMLAIATALVFGVLWDKLVTWQEAILLIIAYIVYLLYTILHKEGADSDEINEVLPGRMERREHEASPVNIKAAKVSRPKLVAADFIYLFLGIVGLFLGAKYLIDSVITLSDLFGIGAGVISLAAVALGTSLPELLVSIKAAMAKKSEVALGNIFGSNVFNVLGVIGIPALFKNLVVDEQTFSLGIPIMIMATILFVISGISRRIHVWEGAMYLTIYVFFIGKLFNII